MLTVMDDRRGCLVVVAILLLTLSVEGHILKSMYEHCPNEGEVIDVSAITNMTCYKCSCFNGFVQCTKDPCPDNDGCFAYQNDSNKTDNCCIECKDCLYNGVMRKSGSKWMNPNNPCEELSCKSNVVSVLRHQCYVPCQNPLPPKPGTCCPRCPGCLITGRELTPSKNVSMFDDPCLTCHCEKNPDSLSLVCLKKSCPYHWCPSNNIYIPSGECCPRCISENRKRLPSMSKSKCYLGEKTLYYGQVTKMNRCMECTCTNETVECISETCPPLDCPVETQTFASHNQCCPICPEATEKGSSCVQNGLIYTNGENWNIDDCKSCSCIDGIVQCSLVICPPLPVPCPLNTKRTTDMCCPRCTMRDGVCSVYGNSNYRTYDSKSYHFPGPCKYLLTEDCVNRTFSIRVTNDAKTTSTGAWTKTINLRLNYLRVNLGVNKRVKVNGQRVIIPYQKNNQLIISNINNSVLVNTTIGLSILWDGHGYLEVTVPVQYKGKLCGLCGNFNMDPRDDLTTKNGDTMPSVKSFGSSWRMGGMKFCSRPLTPHLKKKNSLYTKKSLSTKAAYCNTLNNQDLVPCHKTLNYLNFYLSCLIDMRECPTGRKCYCASTIAYAQQCRRFGLSLNTSNVLSDCTSY